MKKSLINHAFYLENKLNKYSKNFNNIKKLADNFSNKIKDSNNKDKGVTINLKYKNSDNDSIEINVPGKYIICPECSGIGQIIEDNSLDTLESKHDKDLVLINDFVFCNHCNGKGIHKIFDPDRATIKEKEAYRKYKFQKLKKEASEQEDDLASSFNKLTDIANNFIKVLNPGGIKNFDLKSVSFKNIDINNIKNILESLKDLTDKTLKSINKDIDSEDRGDNEKDFDITNKGMQIFEIVNKASSEALSSIQSGKSPEDVMKYIGPLMLSLSKGGSIDNFNLSDMISMLSSIGSMVKILQPLTSQMGNISSIINPLIDQMAASK